MQVDSFRWIDRLPIFASQFAHYLIDLTITGALLTACTAAFLLIGKLWEHRYGLSRTFTFDNLKPLVAGAAIVTALLLFATMIFSLA